MALRGNGYEEGIDSGTLNLFKSLELLTEVVVLYLTYRLQPGTDIFSKVVESWSTLFLKIPLTDVVALV